MVSIVSVVLGLVFLMTFIASLWYLCQTIRVMWGFNYFVAIAAVFLSPLIHIVFYFFPKDGFDNYKRGLFKKYFLSLGAMFIFGIAASVLIPAMQSKKENEDAYDTDRRAPWEWVIRSERLE